MSTQDAEELEERLSRAIEAQSKNIRRIARMKAVRQLSKKIIVTDKDDIEEEEEEEEE